NIQSVFARSLGAQWAEKQIHGFYLATFAGANDNRSIYNKMFGWLTNYGHPNDKCDLFLSGGVEIMEFAMADNTGSTIGDKKTDNGIIPVREDSSGSEIEYLKKAARLQSGIISFFEYVKPLIQKGNYAALSSVVLSEPFFELIARPSSVQLDALSSLTHSESAGSNAERIVLAKKLPLKDKLFPGENYIKELNASYWKEGFKRINRKKFWAKYN
ncbi:glycosyl transferase, partial [Salmonella enterica]|nr:glycosyl transferase [Salmonella enterica]EJE4773464.1 glycosyl transferase [Salmonella enterica]EJQ9243797.1 glycosyl transferase [Salmonella enterica]